jgi:signal transduction histidine kinase
MIALPIRIRLTLGFTIVMAIAFAVIGFVIYTRAERSLDSTLRQGLQTRSAEVAALVGESDNGLVGGRGTWGEGFAQILTVGGTVFDSSPGLARTPVLSRALIARALRSPVAVDLKRGHQRVRVLAKPVDAQGQLLVVAVGTSLETRDEALTGLRHALFLGGPLALLLAAFAGYGLAAAALRPLEEMRARERRFVADASHELRTPLALLRAELELALDAPRSRDELEAALRSAALETDRVVQLAEDLLLLARVDQDKLQIRPQLTRLDDLFEGVAARFERRAEEAGRRIAYDGRGLSIVVDRLRVEQAIGNLLDNALRHGRGTVTIEAEPGDERVILHVRDEGEGIRPDLAGRALERFGRLDPGRGGGGTGLGLAIVAEIARAHGAAVEIAAADISLAFPIRSRSHRRRSMGPREKPLAPSPSS